MQERIEWLRQAVQVFESEEQKEFLHKLIGVIRDLIHKVEEFEPEQITMDEMNMVQNEYEKARVQVINENASRVERDKLARDLVEVILRDEGLIGPTVIELAEQLQEKLDATKK